VVPACIKNIDVPSSLAGVAAIHKHTDGTYFLLTDGGYWTYTSDEQAGDEELTGTTDYS